MQYKPSPEQVASVVTLADRHRRWLGFLPAAAIQQMAERGRLVVALDQSRVVGYVLFDLPGADVRIVHLCVAEDGRGKGVAKQLVHDLSQRFSDRRGIRLRCRRDWPAATMWPRLGFRPTGEVAGRGASGTVLTTWWREHSHPTLFSLAPEPLVLAAMDTDVFSAVYGGSDVVDSEALVLAPDSPLLNDQVELVATSELARELNETSERTIRKRLLTSLSGFRMLQTEPQEVERAAEALLDLVPEAVRESDPSLASDARLIGAAQVGGAEAYVTCDRGAIKHLGPGAAELWGLHVLLPVDLLLHARNLQTNYLPAALANTSFTIVDVGIERRSDLSDFLNAAKGERRREWDERLATALASSLATDGVRRLVLDVNRSPVGILVARRSSGAYTVDVLRSRRHHLGASIARQLVAQMRETARAEGLERVIVEDSFTDESSGAALVEEGYLSSHLGPVAHVLDVVATQDDPRLDPLLADMPARGPDFWAEVEHRGWPLKVLGTGVTCAIVPIRPQFAADLLGFPILTSRPAPLGLSREHVYYRAPRGALAPPARLLWYASSPVSAIVAASSVLSVRTAPADELHAENARYGVWSRAMVRHRAQGGRVQAIRFRDTELLRPVNFEKLSSLSASDRLRTLRTVTPINEEAFFNIYAAGRRQ